MFFEIEVFQECQRFCDVGIIDGSDFVGSVFIWEGKVVVKRYWFLFIYFVLLMVGFNFMSYGSQDLYFIMLKNQFGFNVDQVMVM